MGRRLSGRVGEEVRRVERRVGEGVGVGGVCQGKGEEDMACKFQDEGDARKTQDCAERWWNQQHSENFRTRGQAGKLNYFILF